MVSGPPFHNRLAAVIAPLTETNVKTVQPGEDRPHLLVAIASFGEKNFEFLKRIIHNYHNMPMDVDVVVFSDKPKDLGRSVKVIVGLPMKDPWSLPFAHKAYFAQNVDRYDLFVYSEDDMEVTEENVHAFLRVTPELESTEIAGFLRYEIDESGNYSFPEMHGPFHWKPESVKRRGAYTIAEFTNEHAAFYLLTQDQLRKVIASGNFLRKPCVGQYDMLCTAATDPYAHCGFRKVICISMMEDFLIHHLPNRYAGKLGLSLEIFKEQIQTLNAIQSGLHPAQTLGETQSKIPYPKWPKNYYETPDEQLIKTVPPRAKTILSIGCGWGATEAQLKQRGAKVTGLPLDSVIGGTMARQGIEVIYGTWEKCLRILGSRQFECVLMKDLLHLQPDSLKFLGQCTRFVEKGGTLILAGPNFDRMPWLIKRILGVGEFRELRSFDQSGVTLCGPGTLIRTIKDQGFHVTTVRWLNHRMNRGGWLGNRLRLGKFTARDWILQARR